MKTLLLLGGNILNSGFADVAKRSGWNLRVIDWNGAKYVDWLDSSAVEQKDIKDINLPKEVASLPLAFCYSSADVAAENVVRINRQAGLFGADTDAILNCVHKNRAYECFEQAGVLGRAYECIEPEVAKEGDELLKRMRAYLAKERDIVVKPTSSSSSRGVTFLKNPSAEQLSKTVSSLAEEFKSPILVDKYIAGEEYSVEMVVDKDGNVMVWPIGFKGKSIHNTSEAISVKVIYNPVIDDRLKQNIIERAIACAKATGLRSSLAHLEIKLSPWGELYPMEIASRSSGFVATHLCDMAAKRSYLGTYYDILCGKTLDSIYAGESSDSSVYFFYDPPAGRIVTDIKSDNVPFKLPDFYITHANPLTVAGGKVIGEHKDDETKKNFLVIRTKKRAGLHEEMIRLEKDFYERHIASYAGAD